MTILRARRWRSAPPVVHLGPVDQFDGIVVGQVYWLNPLDLDLGRTLVVVVAIVGDCAQPHVLVGPPGLPKFTWGVFPHRLKTLSPEELAQYQLGQAVI